ncbi:MAG: amidohydrolase family protein [Acidimicrobiia bacterium]
MVMHIDTHVHVISEDEERFPLDPSGVTGAWYRDDPCSVERLLRLMDDAGVDAAVLVQAISAYRHDNRYCAESARRFPERCTSVACIDVTASDPIAAARQVVRDEAMRGIRWVAITDGGLQEPRGLWDEIATLEVPVVVTILAHRLAELAATIPNIPSVPLALDHCAFADFSHGVPDELSALAVFPNLYLKVSSNALDLMAAHGDPAEVVAELAGRFDGRLMWGSDYSQTHDRPYGELVEWGRAATAKLSPEHRAGYLGDNAVMMWPELGRRVARGPRR